MTEEELGPLYCDIMEEMKARVTTMSEVACHLRPPMTDIENRHSHFMFKGLYLQLRKVCELLSRGMLVVQSADPAFPFHKFQKEYRADKIFNEINKINSLCFPRPISGGDWIAGNIEHVQEHAPVFDHKSLKDAYIVCDGVLHAWKLGVLKRPRQTELNQDFVKSWVKRLLDGLNHHVVTLPVENRHLFVRMHDPENGNVSCTFASRAE